MLTCPGRRPYICPACTHSVLFSTSAPRPARLRLRPQRTPSIPPEVSGRTVFADVVEAVRLQRAKSRADVKRRQGGRTFLDHLVVHINAGKGGDGSVAFFRDAHIADGPPSGGNGGPGGDILIQAVPGMTSLGGVASHIRGAKGAHGAGKWRHGRQGAPTIIKVPVGTVVRELERTPAKDPWADEDADTKQLSDEEKEKRRRAQIWVHYPQFEERNVDDQRFLQAEASLRKEMKRATRMGMIETQTREPLNLDLDEPTVVPIKLATGGQGGMGNPFFASTENRYPKYATKGREGEQLKLFLELKLLADVGLVGLPNAGKSTLLRALTNAKPEVAGYAFTTLNPQIGTVRLWEEGGFDTGDSRAIEHTAEERTKFLEDVQAGNELLPDPAPHRKKEEVARLTICDNPGLLYRASEDVGLGHTFLRSVERARALVYVVDLSGPSPWDDLAVLRHELEAYREGLSERTRLVIANKADLLGGTEEEDGNEGEAAAAEKAAWDKVQRLEELAGGLDVVPVSAKYRLGLDRVVDLLRGYVEESK